MIFDPRGAGAALHRWWTSAVPTAVGRALARVDIERAGLLSGASGRSRRDLAALLAALYADGVTVAEIRRAVDEADLTSMALQRALRPDAPRYTLDQVAESAGVSTERLGRWFRALERPVTADPADVRYTDADLDVARRLEDYRALGLTEDDILPVARAVGRGVSSIADAIGSVLGARLLADDDPDPATALAYAVEIRRISQRDGLHLSHLLALGLSERVSSHMVALGTRAPGHMEGTREIGIGFADIVGFTALGERVGAVELSALADSLAAATHDALVPPVRITKTIGDAVMLVSPDPDALVRVGLDLNERWSDGPVPEPGAAAPSSGSADRLPSPPERPPLRIGLAWGSAAAHGGDWFGAPVNLASRITAVARPGTVLVDAALRDRCSDDLDAAWTRVRAQRFKGVPGRPELYRAVPGGSV